MFCVFITGCSTPPPPDKVGNACSIYRQYPKWYWAAKRSEKRWGTPAAVQLAFMHQESRFRAKAKPPRTKLLWIIPWFRPTTAYGYSQALKGTWALYKKQSGRMVASRKNYEDATDFIAWYAHYAHKKMGIPLNNAYELYLAYHEGTGGFKRRTYLKKPWLMAVAKKVQTRAWTYQSQLKSCAKRLKKEPMWLRVVHWVI